MKTINQMTSSYEKKDIYDKIIQKQWEQDKQHLKDVTKGAFSEVADQQKEVYMKEKIKLSPKEFVRAAGKGGFSGFLWGFWDQQPKK